MKNLLIIAVVLPLFLLLGQTSNAQTCFDKGTITINPGIGIGYYGYYGNPSTFSVPVILSAEYHFTELISGGLFISRSSYNYSNFSRSYTGFGARASFHWVSLLEKWTGGDWKSDKFDLYSAAIAGYEIGSFKRKDGYSGFVSSSNNRLIPGIVAGARWYFIPNIAVYAEVGGGFLGFLTGGITIKI